MMTQRFFKCNICGNIVAMVESSGVKIVCCGQNMTELVPNTSDGALEKHVPVIAVDGNKVQITVGSVQHPMTQEHYIKWILIHTDRGNQRKELKPEDAPVAEFILCEGEKLLEAYAYCNLHGLWKATAD